MVQSRVPSAVFLDTEVFVGAGFNLRSRDFMRLRSLVKAGTIQLISTCISEKEVESQLQQKINQSTQALSKFRRSVSSLSDLSGSFLPQLEGTEAEIESRFLSMHSDYLTVTKPTILGLEGVDISEMFSLYFDGKPPFGKGKKKSEFPDAAAALALENWCRSQNRSIHIVGKDGDWASLCKTIDCFNHYERLIELFSLFPDPLKAAVAQQALIRKSDSIDSAVKSDFPQGFFYLTDRDGEVGSVEVISVQVEQFYVVEMDSTSAVVEVDCLVEFIADVTYNDPDSWTYDSEEKQAIYVYTINRVIECEASITVELQVSFVEDDVSSLEIEDIYVPNDSVDVTVDDDDYR